MSEGERRLAAIMFTDMVGYMALTQSDESQAMQVLERHNRLLRPLFPKFHGREIKAIGDSFLVEFDSALEAIRCAVELQEFLHDYNLSSRDAWKIQLRIGIHLGDVIHRAGDIFGDTVNIAARMEPFARPEGICVSQQVRDQIRNKFELPLFSLGSKPLKSVSQPVEIYGVQMPWEEKPQPPTADIRRIAVLPFANISSDPSDEYFADGLTEELIGNLSQVGGLEVIARTSVMSFRKQEKKVSEIARELGVGSVVEGSVRKAGNRIRVAVQLINANSESHLWSSNYDRDLNDIFAIQTDIASKVAESLPASLIATKLTRPLEKETDDITAYTYFLHGRHLLLDPSESSLRRAMDFFKQAVEREPDFARAYVGMAECSFWMGQRGFEPFLESIEDAKRMLHKALLLNPQLPEGHSTLAFIKLGEDDVAGAQSEAESALRLNSNLPIAYWVLGEVEATTGDPNESVRLLEKGYHLDPLEPNLIGELGRMYSYTGKEMEALELWNRTVNIAPNQTYSQLTEYYISKGDHQKASEFLTKLRGLQPSSPWVLTWTGYLAALDGDRKTALTMIRRIEEVTKGGNVTASLTGFVWNALGDLDAFFEQMDRATKMHALPIVLLRFSPLFANARKDVRFQNLH